MLRPATKPKATRFARIIRSTANDIERDSVKKNRERKLARREEAKIAESRGREKSLWAALATSEAKLTPEKPKRKKYRTEGSKRRQAKRARIRKLERLGLSQEDLLSLLETQGHKCAICREAFTLHSTC